MLASDGFKFLSPNQFGSLIVKNQEDICSHCIETFPQGHKGGNLSFMRNALVTRISQMSTTAPCFDTGALRILRNLG